MSSNLGKGRRSLKAQGQEIIVLPIIVQLMIKHKQIQEKTNEVVLLREKVKNTMIKKQEQLPLRRPTSLRVMLDKEEKIVEELKKIAEKRKQQLTQAATIIRSGMEYNAIFDQKYLEAHEKYNADRQKLQEYEKKLRLRQHKMCRQLLHIFPFRKNHATDNTQLYITNYIIRNMPLPSRIDKLMEIANTGGQEEEKMSICLGYIAHLCTLLSRYLELPLRHPIICRGSRSLIVDAFLEAETFASVRENKSNKWNPEYPLYSKGIDRGRFKHAISLLRENICQLCTQCKIKEYQPDTFTHNIRSVLYSMALAS